jgi:hypothetical protein
MLPSVDLVVGERQRYEIPLFRSGAPPPVIKKVRSIRPEATLNTGTSGNGRKTVESIMTDSAVSRTRLREYHLEVVAALTGIGNPALGKAIQKDRGWQLKWRNSDRVSQRKGVALNRREY